MHKIGEITDIFTREETQSRSPKYIGGKIHTVYGKLKGFQ